MDRDRAEGESGEDLSQLIRRVMSERTIAQRDVARLTGIHESTISAWIRRTRGSRRPRPEYMEMLADGLGLTRDEVYAAAGRTVPGRLTPDAEARVLAIFRDLTAEQQRMFELQMEAVREGNRPAAS